MNASGAKGSTLRPVRGGEPALASHGQAAATKGVYPTSIPKLHVLAAVPLSQPRRHTALELWHLLSLDAPCIAATWTFFIGWAAGIKLSPLDPVAIFLAVWMLYAADRLLDARSLFVNALAPDLEERHHFHHRHRHMFLPALVGATLPLIWLLHRLNAAALHLYTLLAVLLAGWLLLVHAQDDPDALARRLPKEIAVGVFFAAAVFIATVARVPGLRLSLAPSALLFGGVCSLNCLLLYAWEHPEDRSRAHASTSFAIRHLPLIVGVLLALSVCLALWGFVPQHSHPAKQQTLAHPAAIPLCCALSIVLLHLLHRKRRRIAPVPLRALADLVLLTPLLLLSMEAVGLAR